MKINEGFGREKLFLVSIILLIRHGVFAETTSRSSVNLLRLRGRSASQSLNLHTTRSKHSKHVPRASQASETRHLRKANVAKKQEGISALQTRAKHRLDRKGGASRRKLQQETGRCRRKKLIWYMRIRIKCQKGFGEESKWDRSKMGGQCGPAFRNCQTGFWSVCCSQPKGPKDMDAFCEKEAKEGQLKNTGKKQDAACAVQKMVQGVKRDMSAIKNTVTLLDKGEDEDTKTQDLAVASPSAAAPATTTAGQTSTTIAADSDADTDTDEEPPTTTVAVPATLTTIAAAAVAPPTTVAAETPTATIVEQTSTRTIAPSPAAAAITATEQTLSGGSIVVDSLAPAPAAKATSKGLMASRCEDLMALSQQVTKKIDAIKAWAKNEGMRDLPGDDRDTASNSKQDMEDTDPDLAISLKGVLSIGQKLHAMAGSPFCATVRIARKARAEPADDKEDDEEDDQEDEDEAEGEEGTEEDTQATDPKSRKKKLAQSSDGEKDEDDFEQDLKWDPESEAKAAGPDDDEKRIVEDEVLDGGDVKDETTVNTSAILGLLEFDGELTEAVNRFETNVHPHGYKWWRYRYEYTILESFVLAYSSLLMYILQYLIFGLRSYRTVHWHRTGRLVTNYGYPSQYFMHHAAIGCIMVCVAYFLFMPWGDSNPFNVFAEAFHDFVDDSFRVPYVGYSWLYLVLDIQFQLVVMYSLYALFICFVVRNYNQALEDWKTLDKGGEAKFKVNAELYERLLQCMKNRVRASSNVEKQFCDAKLYLKDVKELMNKVKADKEHPTPFMGSKTKKIATPEQDWELFKLHVYLTDALGHSLQVLVEVSVVTNMMLVVCALIVALLAYCFQLAFMYFLPFFILVGFLILGSGFFLSKHYINLSEDMEHQAESKRVTIMTYSRSVQIIVYCIFYSFARLLLSQDIFVHYPKTYLMACISLVIVFSLLAIFGGELLKEAMCALSFIPHIGVAKFERKLMQSRSWHTDALCHECGTTQRSWLESHSKKWAGKDT